MLPYIREEDFSGITSVCSLYRAHEQADSNRGQGPGDGGGLLPEPCLSGHPL